MTSVEEILDAWERLCAISSVKVGPCAGYMVIEHDGLQLAFLKKTSVRYGHVIVHGYGEADLTSEEYKHAEACAKARMQQHNEAVQRLRASRVIHLIGKPKT